MILDVHVHVSACTPGHGWLSPTMQRHHTFRLLSWIFGLPPYGPDCERAIEDLLAQTINQTPEVDAGVVLAFDAVHNRDGQLDEPRTHFYVTNDYVIELCKKYSKMLFGCSVHPYRKDAVAEIERCVKAGAVLMKWLPIVQDFNPADPRCLEVYECLAHYRLPLLSHTGGEKSLPVHDLSVADPMLLEPALARGVTVIAAHCGTRSAGSEPDFLPQFMHLARKYEKFYGDTAALSLPARSYAFPMVLKDKIVRTKLVHGSDWPIPAVPPATHLRLADAFKLFFEKNWLRRDVLIKQKLGFDEDYWRRAAEILGLPSEYRLRRYPAWKTDRASESEKTIRKATILASALFHAPPPRDPDRPTANSAWVLRYALELARKWEDSMNDAFHGYDESYLRFPDVWWWYSALIELTVEVPGEEPMLRGAGNLEYPAGAHFTACWLTPAGRAEAERLLSEHPEWETMLRTSLSNR